MPQLAKRTESANGHDSNPGPTCPPVLTAALRLHDAGWWVVPQAGRRAVALGWEQVRLSADDLREYLSGGRLNIAVVLNQSDVIDVECDTPEAEAALVKLCGGAVPRTPTWKSRRGLHRLFKRPDGCPEKAAYHDEHGIEYRLGCGPRPGALSTVPPSVHPDDPTVVYTWLPLRSVWECEPAVLPDGLVGQLKKAAKKPSRDLPEHADAIPEGMRNDALFGYGSRAARTMDMNAVADLLHGANQSRCQPPLEVEEVNAIVESVGTQRERGKSNLLPARCTSWAEVVGAWREAAEWRQEMADLLAVLFAVCASTSQAGSQLFLQVVGSPGSFKTRFCDALLVSPKCKRLEKLTGVLSGRMDYDNPKKDYSFLGRANHMTWITPEADIAMSQPSWHELMSQMRRVFDGSASASYKNRDVEIEHNGLRTPWIMAGTPTMIEHDQSRLGDRFLRFHIADPDEDTKQRILYRVGMSAWQAVGQESNCSPDSIHTPQMTRAYRLTGGYVNWLRDNVTRRVADVKANSDAASVVRYCKVLADFTAFMRSRPPVKTGYSEPDYEATKDLPTRLQEQFVRLAACVAVVLQKDRVDAEVLGLVRRVALDTATGRTLRLAGWMYRCGLGGATPASLEVWAHESKERVERWLAHMRKVGAAEWFNPTDNGVVEMRKYRLTPRLQSLYREVLGGETKKPGATVAPG